MKIGFEDFEEMYDDKFNWGLNDLIPFYEAEAVLELKEGTLKALMGLEIGPRMFCTRENGFFIEPDDLLVWWNQASVQNSVEFLRGKNHKGFGLDRA